MSCLTVRPMVPSTEEKTKTHGSLPIGFSTTRRSGSMMGTGQRPLAFLPAGNYVLAGAVG